MESATLQATRDIQTIDESILTSEKAFAEIREKISSVSESAGSTLKETNVGKNQSQTLSEMAASLNELLKNFRI